jgi:hypothetical protein
MDTRPNTNQSTLPGEMGDVRQGRPHHIRMCAVAWSASPVITHQTDVHQALYCQIIVDCPIYVLLIFMPAVCNIMMSTDRTSEVVTTLNVCPFFFPHLLLLFRKTFKTIVLRLHTSSTAKKETRRPREICFVFALFLALFN